MNKHSSSEGIDDSSIAAFLDAEPPSPDDRVAFDAPWQARAFSIARALCEHHDLEWSAFNDRFVEYIQDAGRERLERDHERAYYELWLEALEATLVANDMLTEHKIDRRAAEFESGVRDASEFVVNGDGAN
ncbi:nitrile hydratase accessory protein [Saliphagus sp. GCM10025334]